MAIRDILGLDPNEQILQQIKRHPVGLIWIYLSGAVGIITLLILLFVSVRSTNGLLINLSDFSYGVLFGILILVVAAVTYVGAYTYRLNELVITNENIIQLLQFSLLNRQISQLNLAKIQDVSVDRVGILSTFVDYGTIDIETAGEASNFRFDYVANPNRVAKIIIEAHEDYVRRIKGGIPDL